MTASKNVGAGQLPHAHRWRIEEPDGPVSAGSCACGASRDFWNADKLDRPRENWNDAAYRRAK